MSGKFVPLKLFGLKTTSFEQWGARYCYGYIKDNIISLFLLSNYLKVSKSPPNKPIFEAKIDHDIEFTKLKLRIQQMNDTMTDIDFRLSMLERMINDTEHTEKQSVSEPDTEQSTDSIENPEINSEESEIENPENTPEEKNTQS
jgi:hypothetical protein